MGRWAYQDIEAVSKWPISKLYRRWAALSKLIEMENPKPK